MKRTINLMIIGLGPHAQRLYLPALFKREDVKLVVGVDLKSKEKNIQDYLERKNFPLDLLLLDPFENPSVMPSNLEAQLNKMVLENNIDGIVIATEPLVHQVYALWALKQGLHILMDKPVSGRENVVSDPRAAEGLWGDYEHLKKSYDELQKTKDTIFSVVVHRRYHLGFRKVMALIKEVAARFKAPVTSIQSMHADGQWRLPNEMVDQLYHPYCQGYGKCSHSGYHIFDIASQFYKAGFVEGKQADAMELMSSFVQPRGFLKQFNEQDYARYFGADYAAVKKRDDNTLNGLFENYGEMDAFMLGRFLKEGENVCNFSLNLLHNSFARRTWVEPGKDLYKGNGRVKHEMHTIQQGPFQCIQIHSYQASDQHDKNTQADYQLGGNNHFELQVFRNAHFFGENEQALKTYAIQDLDVHSEYAETDLAHETAKEQIVSEFLLFIQGGLKKQALLSNIDQHAMPVQMMSAAYRSHIQQQRKESAFIHWRV